MTSRTFVCSNGLNAISGELVVAPEVLFLEECSDRFTPLAAVTCSCCTRGNRSSTVSAALLLVATHSVRRLMRAMCRRSFLCGTRIERKRVMDTSWGILGALVTGLSSSLHCAMMCGPLACAAVARSGKVRSAFGWHLGRLLAYTWVGAALGALGRVVSQTLLRDAQSVLPWVMATGLILAALDVRKYLPVIPGFQRIVARLGASAPSTSFLRDFALGAATPFLPCGVLFGIFLTAIATASAWGGAAILFVFAWGAVPVLVMAQLGSRWLQRHVALSPWLRRGVPLVAAAVVMARALVTRAAPELCH